MLHPGIHSFTPVMNGTPATRTSEFHDPARPADARNACQKKFSEKYPEFKTVSIIRTAGGGWIHHRVRKNSARYIGLEIEINQALLNQSSGNKDYGLSALFSQGLQ